jgi:uncharacterized protein
MEPHNHGFYFVTGNGNEYLYDDTDGSVVPTQHAASKSEEAQYTNWISSWRLEAGCPELDMRRKIEDALLTGGYTQLQLIVTEQCNLRCKYCAFSGSYANNRTHNDRYMGMDVAEKAIRRFHEGFRAAKVRRPNMIAAVSFYGGEPLLNFHLIRSATGLARQVFPGRVRFNLTTNATIMTDEMIGFFLENDFALMFSLNGYRDEHNRLRTYGDGTGSYDVVWHNLQKVRHKNANYYRDNCALSVVYDYGTDIRRIYDFFRNRGQLLPYRYQFSSVNQGFTEWYRRYSDQDVRKYDASLQYLRELYLRQIRNGEKPSELLRQICGLGFLRLLSREQNTSGRSALLPYSGTCFPGSKIAVDPGGVFHCCERINQSFPIGDADTGLDVDLVQKLIVQYRAQVYGDCCACPIKRLCPICFATLAAGAGKFEKDPPDMCQRLIEATKNGFSVLWTLLEQGVSERAIANDESPDRAWRFWE